MRRGTEGRPEAPSRVPHSAGGELAVGRPRSAAGMRSPHGSIPGRCRLGARASSWFEVAVDTWIQRKIAGCRGQAVRPLSSVETKERTMEPLSRMGATAARAVLALLWLLSPALIRAQGTSPRVEAVNELQAQFPGPIARGLSLIAVVIGGLMFAFGEGGSKRMLAGIIFGLGMAMGAANFLAWLV